MRFIARKRGEAVQDRVGHDRSRPYSVDAGRTGTSKR
jgi:hypothetical protein